MDSTRAEVHPPGAPVVSDEKLPATEKIATTTPVPPAIEEKLAAASIPSITSASIPDAPKPAEEENDLVAKVLRFLSTATPEALGAVAVGLAASTYFILGKVGLVLIGAFGGVVTFITYEARHPEVSRAVRGEKGIDVLQRLALVKIAEPPKNDAEEEDRLIHGFDDFQPETREALTGLVDAIIRDYVKWWYSPILPNDSSFPLSCRRLLNSFLLSVSNHLYRKRPADSFIDFMTNASSMFIVFLSELSSAFTEQHNDPNSSAVDIIAKYLEDNPNSNLANLLNHPQQAAKFRNVADDLLGFLDRSAYNCDPARAFLREILAGVILEMSLQSFSKPEWINGWIVYLLEAGEPDFSQAIDVGMQTGPDAANASNVSSANNNAFVDIDGNLGNISLAKGNRNSLDMERERRKGSSAAHKKQLSKADEEMEEAMEEMKRMNALIAEEEAKRATARQSVDSMPRPTVQATESNIVSSPGELSPRSLSSAEKPSTNGSHGSHESNSSNKGESVHSPITPRSAADSSSQKSSPKHTSNGSTSQFLNFDQIVPPAKEDPEASEEGSRKPPLTLHNATITLYEDGNDSSKIRSKPTWEYMVQIEPSSSHHPGWMIVRQYSDFETLHEILRRIATISGVTAFTEQHSTLPNWKSHTRASLRGELERYVKDACWYKSLAESEGMKRFLEKESGHGHSSSKSGLAWDTVGKNMLDVLTMGPKGAMEGGKAVFGGVTGVFNNIGLGPRKNTTSSLSEIQTSNRWSTGTPPRMDSITSLNAAVTSPTGAGPRKGRDSLDSQRSSIVATQPGKIAPMERRPSFDPRGDSEADGLKPRSDRWERNSTSATGSREHSRASSLAPLQSPALRSPSSTSLDVMNLQYLPPPPDEMPEDYQLPTHGDIQSNMNDLAAPRNSTGAASLSPPQAQTTKKGPKPARQHPPLSEQETNVAVELVFAIINEMYTLSSAWNIRRTLLAAAKSFLLRPGNPSLLSIQKMMQESVIDANTKDEGLAHHLRKLRENTMPTDEERATWPSEMTDEEKEKLRIKARNLLIKRGVPAALSGVMGQAATTDALGRIFDSLQIEEVARGFMFGMLLQAVRVITH
ncbi:PXA domain-containing protein [Colletotrichum navitas]|uniref:PXA domain-containing protein n=1 Tax=Colletotrichum navitas TaxID=681940 RepID=A0AAD8PJ92_9PEZI|nr:PXA domain-containing protein [Colletotrichum navitas]KAK1564239.1 PXA domain-containing protein [Colletotrichum navitas]